MSFQMDNVEKQNLHQQINWEQESPVFVYILLIINKSVNVSVQKVINLNS